MSKEDVIRHINNIEELAKKEGLDFYPTIFEFVNRDLMLEACSYGLPVRARHWSYGRSYIHQKIFGEMGMSKVYEIVFNNNPSYAFLLDTNPDIINIMVAAHVYGHVHFFKNNVMFQNSDRSMVYKAAERASRVDKYVEQFGLDKVEHLMDIGFALDGHIDWHKGIFRKKYPERQIIERKVRFGEFEDLLNIGDYSKRSIKRVVVGDKIPPHPEKDLLWFLINYAPLEEWEKDILGIIREESYYFYPIVATKIANEGFACITSESLVFTENGIMSMKNVVEKRPSIFDGNNVQRVVHSGVFSDRDTIKIHTRRGLTICGADNHRVLDQGNNWKRLDEIKLGDTIKISGGDNLWSKEYKKIVFSEKVAKSIHQLCKQYEVSYNTYHRNISKTHSTKEQNIEKINEIKKELAADEALGCVPSVGTRKKINIPEILDENLAAFIGYIVGDGHISLKGRQIGLTSGDESIKDHFVEISSNLFDVKSSVRWDDSSKNGRWRAIIFSKTLIKFLKDVFGLSHGVTARTKQIPSLIMQSPKPVVSAFLRAYFDCDGCASSKSGVILSTSSDSLAEDTQIILLNYGILSGRSKAKDGCWQLRITGKSARIFYNEIGFGLKRKQEKLKAYIDGHKQWHQEKWFDTISKIEYCGKQDVYDISVENSHRYTASGFINHNSFWHAELMNKYSNISEGEFLEFAKCHSSVVNPGGQFNINPYYLGFKVFTDIREKWDKLYKEGKSDINGIQKVIQVAAEEDDASFLRNYLTVDLATELGLFNYGYKVHRDPDMKEKDLKYEHGLVEIKDRDLDKIIEHITRSSMNYGVPLIYITEVDGDILMMKHDDRLGPLDEKYTEKTMEYLYELWGGPIEISTYDFDGEEFVYCFDESGLDIM